MSDRLLATGLSVGRIALGSALLADPRRAAALWLGPDAELTSQQTVLRMLGVRDLGLGVGTLLALRSGDDLAGWLGAALAADATDLAANVAAGPALPTGGRALVAGMAGAATLIGLKLLRSAR